MTDDSDPPRVVRTAQVKEEIPQISKENNTDVNAPQPSNPPETPPHPQSGSTDGGARAPEPMSLPERHQSALRHIRTLESHNAKLYEDNCRLVNAVNMLNDRLAFFGAPQTVQMHRLADMQEKLRVSETSWASISRKYQELLQSISADSAPHHVGMELQTVRDAYASLDREYRLLRDKYLRLKAAADPNRVVQQQPQGIASVPHVARGHFPVVRPEFPNVPQFRAHPFDQGRTNVTSPTSVVAPGSFPPFLDQQGTHRRHSSESTVAQPSLRTGPVPGPIATTWLAPLPTPPPSAQLLGGQISPKGFPVHAPVPAGSLPLPHHAQMIHGARNLPELSAMAQSQHLAEQVASEPLKTAENLRHRSGENTVNNELAPCSNPAPATLQSDTRPQKRPSIELQDSTSQGGEHKKPRTEGEPDHPTIISADGHPPDKIPSPVASADPHDDCKLSVPEPDIRSHQDRVNLIFEKDADIENGVFCGLCFDRYEAKMIQEPPDVLVQPDFESLVTHCMTMHPTVWNDLRLKVQ